MGFRFLTLLLLICFTGTLRAQNIKISGHVKGSDGQPVVSATIQLKDMELTKVVAYDFTDSVGYYKLLASLNPGQRLSLIVSCLGFSRDTIEVSTDKASSLDYNVVLKADIKQLSEITIKPPPQAVEVVNDTTKYKVSSFTGPADRNLQDVIKKMPGMEVNSDGTIYFKRRPIDKVLLEDDDLTGKNYKAITQNLKPELVDEIQVVEHWVEDDLLRGIINSDAVVLNLTLKDKRFKKIIGSVDVGYGTNERRDLNATTIAYLGKMKSFGFVSNNNKGASQGDIFKLAGANRRLSSDGKIVNHLIYPNLPFDNDPLVLNNSLSGSFNIVTRVSSLFKVGASFYVAQNKLFNDNTTTSIYHAPINAVTVDQQLQQSSNRHYQADLTSDYLSSKYSRISTSFSAKIRPQEYNSSALSTYNTINSNEVLQSQVDRLQNYHLGLKYTLKASASMAMMAIANFAKDVIDQNYNARSLLYATIPAFAGADHLAQLVKTDFQIAKFDIQMLKKSNFNYLYANLGAELNTAQVYTNLLNEASGTAIPQFLNDYSFKNNKLYLIGKYAYDNRKISVSTLLKTSIVNQKQFATDSSFLMIEPEVNLKATITSFQSVSLGYNYKNVLANPLDYHAQPVLTDLRTMNIGLNRLYNFGAHGINFLYTNAEFNDKYFSFNVNANAQLYDGGFIGGNFFQDAIYYAQKIAYKGSRSFSAGLGLEKLIPFLGSRFAVDYSPSVSNFYAKVETEINNYRSTTNFLKTSITTGFNLPLNFTFEFQSQSTVTEKEGVAFNKQNSYKYRFQSRYQVSKTLYNLIDFNWYRVDTKDYRLLNVELLLKPAKGVFSYSLHGENLGNFKSIDNLFISNVGETRSRTSVLGRYFLASVSMSIK